MEISPNQSVAETALIEKAKASAQDFEAMFLKTVFEEMFKNIHNSEPFGGGFGEEMFQSFFVDSLTQSMSKKSIGIADMVFNTIMKQMKEVKNVGIAGKNTTSTNVNASARTIADHYGRTHRGLYTSDPAVSGAVIDRKQSDRRD